MREKEVPVRHDLLFQQLGSYLGLVLIVFSLPLVMALALEHADLGTALLLFVACFTIPPFAAYLWAFFFVKTVSYKLTGRGIEVSQGIVFRVQKTVPYSKITEVVLVEGPFERMLGIKSIRVFSRSSYSRPAVVLRGLKDPEKVRDEILSRLK